MCRISLNFIGLCYHVPQFVQCPHWNFALLRRFNELKQKKNISHMTFHATKQNQRLEAINFAQRCTLFGLLSIPSILLCFIFRTLFYVSVLLSICCDFWFGFGFGFEFHWQNIMSKGINLTIWFIFDTLFRVIEWGLCLCAFTNANSDIVEL